MLKPIGFWSYGSTDDEHSRGRLSQLRALLAAELQQTIGRSQKVNIFQDVAAIPPGTEWEKQIGEALNASSFLIPIVTPALLQSEWCCREIALFREREARTLRRNDLVFPIHYVDIDDLDVSRSEDCHNPEVFAFLRSRQWIDFRALRKKNPESEEVGHKIEAIARSICSALRRTGQNINEQSTGQNSAAQMREPAGKEQRPEEIERRDEDNKKQTETTSADTSREWRAEFSNRGWNSFSIHFWQADEHHKLEFKGSLWLPVESLELDGVTIKRYLRRGRKKEVFAVGTHKDHFELRFRSKSYLRLSDIEFCFDNRPILSSK